MKKLNLQDIQIVPTHNGSVYKRVLIQKGEAESDLIYMNEAYLHPNMKIEPHMHDDMEEFYYFLEGEGLMYVGNEVEKIKAGDRVIVPIKQTHSVENNGDKTILFITFGVKVRLD